MESSKNLKTNRLEHQAVTVKTRKFVKNANNSDIAFFHRSKITRNRYYQK